MFFLQIPAVAIVKVYFPYLHDTLVFPCKKGMYEYQGFRG